MQDLKLEQSTIIICSHEELDVNTACAPVRLVAPPTVQATHLLSPNHALSSTLMTNHRPPTNTSQNEFSITEIQ